ncbi:MAG: hypothetical protein AABX13_01265 [Nanoarchaeota archaeon]
MEKRRLSLGLVALLVAGSWSIFTSLAQSTPSPLIAPSRPKQEEYEQYIKNLRIVPEFLREKPPKIDCNKSKLLDLHQRKFKDIADKTYLYSGMHWDHARWMLLDEVIAADVKFANCFYRPGSREHAQKMQEAIQHYEQKDFQREVDAARVYVYLGDINKARELFYKRSYDEEVIKLTSDDELPALRDRALRDGKILLAGKIEWLFGNKDKAREIITEWKGFPDVIKNIRENIQEGKYFPAIDYPADTLRIPFYREIIDAECRNNASCLELLQNYNINQDNTKALINQICAGNRECLEELQRATMEKKR